MGRLVPSEAEVWGNGEINAPCPMPIDYKFLKKLMTSSISLNSGKGQQLRDFLMIYTQKRLMKLTIIERCYVIPDFFNTTIATI